MTIGGWFYTAMDRLRNGLLPRLVTGIVVALVPVAIGTIVSLAQVANSVSYLEKQVTLKASADVVAVQYERLLSEVRELKEEVRLLRMKLEAVK
ncbi:MAG: DivIVA domain-containing protein [candidate division KSB1 bacterium]|nr:DivIVA domain-containing protein [candidate division KSB1 bacterium]